LVRLRWDPARGSRRNWVLTAAAIWVFVKLPQEWWIHVAQLDVTDTLGAMPWLIPVLVLLGAGLVALGWFWLRPRLPARAWDWRVAAEPLPEEIDTAAERDRWVAAHGRVWSAATAEKVVLLGLLCIIYGELLPGRRTSDLELFLGVAGFVLVNAAISMAVARRSRSVESLLAAFGARVVLNIGMVAVAWWLLARFGGGLNPAATVFYVLLLTLIIALDDRFRPVSQVRFAASAALKNETLT
ncbi:hypothetical protein AB0M20_43465, partial [Actinoplanes sp. NPDC051633]